MNLFKKIYSTKLGKVFVWFFGFVIFVSFLPSTPENESLKQSETIAENTQVQEENIDNTENEIINELSNTSTLNIVSTTETIILDIESNKPIIEQKQSETLEVPKPEQSENYQYFKVVKVVDGDTIDIDYNGKVERLRLIGIDTPETKDPRKPVQCFGIEASNKATQLLLNKSVRIETDSSQGERDKYNRLLAYVFLQDNTFYNRYMIQNGYAHEYTYNLPYKYQSDFKSSEKYARENNLGLWNKDTCNDEPAPDVTTTEKVNTITENKVPDVQTEQKTESIITGNIYYTSSYYSAKYYYCDTDLAWKDLSTKYLKSFNSVNSLLSAFPNRTLHEPCK